MKRTCKSAAGLAAATLLLSACSGSGSETSRPQSSEAVPSSAAATAVDSETATEPQGLDLVEPLLEAQSVATVPKRPADPATTEGALNAVEENVGSSEGAEQFSVELIAAIQDTRPDSDIAGLLSRVAVGGLADGQQNAIADTYQSQAASGINRRWDQSLPMAVRSAESEAGFAVEIAGAMVSDYYPEPLWEGYRVDLTVGDGQFVVSAIGATIVDVPPGVDVVGPDDLMPYLTGPGWRTF